MVRETPELPFRLYAITERKRCAPLPLYDVINQLLDVSVTAIQLRERT